MKYFEDNDGGVLPPKKKKWQRGKIIGGISAAIVIVTVMAMTAFGNVRDFMDQGSAILSHSLNETFGLDENSHSLISEVDVHASSGMSDGFDASDASSSFLVSNVGSGFVGNKISGDATGAKKSKKSGATSANLGLSNAGIGALNNVSESDSDSRGNDGDSPAAPISSTASILISSQTSSAPKLKDQSPPLCSFNNLGSSTSLIAGILLPRVILNEIAWMGSLAEPGETTATASSREWIEIKNISSGDIDLAGWQVLDSAGKIKIQFGAGDHIASGAVYLIARGSTSLPTSGSTDIAGGDGDLVEDISPDKAYSGALPNAGDAIGIFDAGCGLSDMLDASQGWPGGDNTTKQTLERAPDGVHWQTSALPGGTPRAENSSGAPISSATSTVQYSVSVTVAGDGPGVVTSKPSGITCPGTCTFSYAPGTALTLLETSGKNINFGGWSGACSGTSNCSFIVGGTAYVTAEFRSALAIPVATDPISNAVAQDEGEGQEAGVDPTSSAAQAGSSPPIGSGVDHALIAAVQIGGASSTNDFVKLYNPTSAVIDMGGWKLRKRSSTGAEYSLRDFPKGTAIASAVYFIWANSSGGFAQSIDADASSTETLAADNSIALFDANGALVDAVAWGTGANQYGEGSPYPADPEAHQVLARTASGGTMVDTDNNATDFVLQ